MNLLQYSIELQYVIYKNVYQVHKIHEDLVLQETYFFFKASGNLQQKFSNVYFMLF